MKVDVSIIIVNYNTKDLLINCLYSIYKQTKDISYEVIISDNGSSDGSIEAVQDKFPKAILVQNNKNLGFGTANNKALSKASGNYILYLNSDTILLNNAVKLFFEFWEKKSEILSLGGLGCYLQNSKGLYIHSGGNFPSYFKIVKSDFIYLLKHIIKDITFRILKQNSIRHLKTNTVRLPSEEFKQIGYVTGADLFLKNDAYAKFDEKYFLYYEETDLQYQIKKEHKKFFLLTTPKIVHLEKTGCVTVTNFSEQQALISSVIYAKKNLVKKALLLKFIVELDREIPSVRSVVKKYNNLSSVKI